MTSDQASAALVLLGWEMYRDVRDNQLMALHRVNSVNVWCYGASTWGSTMFIPSSVVTEMLRSFLAAVDMAHVPDQAVINLYKTVTRE